MYNKSKDIGKMLINVYYKHQKVSKNLDWSGVSVSLQGDISTGFDIEKTAYYETMESLKCEISVVYK